MKIIKIYLAIVTVLLIVGLGFGVYAWYTIQSLNSAAQTVQQPVTTEGVPPTSTIDTETSPLTSDEPVVISTSDMTDTQKSILKGLGYDAETFTVTPAMITCAKDAVGAIRYEEILNGSAPNPLESIKLLPCFKA